MTPASTLATGGPRRRLHARAADALADSILHIDGQGAEVIVGEGAQGIVGQGEQPLLRGKSVKDLLRGEPCQPLLGRETREPLLGSAALDKLPPHVFVT